MFTRNFWKDTLERAVKTFCQSLVAVGLAGATDLLSVDWMNAFSIAGLATVISILTSIAGINTGDKSTAGIVKLREEE